MTKENRVVEEPAMVGVGSPKLDSQARGKKAEVGVHLRHSLGPSGGEGPRGPAQDRTPCRWHPG